MNRKDVPTSSQATRTTEAAIHTTLMADLYVVLGEAVEGGGHVVRIYHNPLVPWIWGGCMLMALGGLASLADRRLRRTVGERRLASLPAGT